MKNKTIKSNVVVNNNNKGGISMRKSSNLKETIKSAIKYAAKDLELAKYPKVIFKNNLGDGNNTFIMASENKYYYQGFLFDRVITKTETNYILYINKDAFINCYRRHILMFGSVQAANDYMYLLVCHELRHMWQAENQFTIGDKYNDIFPIFTLEGHGCTKTERDANAYMIEVGKRKNLKDLAEYIEVEQRIIDTTTIFDSSKLYDELMIKQFKAIKNYNKFTYSMSALYVNVILPIRAICKK